MGQPVDAMMHSDKLPSRCQIRKPLVLITSAASLACGEVPCLTFCNIEKLVKIWRIIHVCRYFGKTEGFAHIILYF